MSNISFHFNSFEVGDPTWLFIMNRENESLSKFIRSHAYLEKNKVSFVGMSKGMSFHETSWISVLPMTVSDVPLTIVLMETYTTLIT